MRDTSNLAVERVLDEAVRRGERWMARGRLFFCMCSFAVVINGSWFWIDGAPSERGWFILVSAGLFISFSLWLIRRTNRPSLSRWTLALSVIADALMAFIALLGNALWPDAAYRGNFIALEASAIILTIVISGFRLSPPIVWLSIAVNAALASVLYGIDIANEVAQPSLRFWIKIFVYLGSASILAMIIALHTRRLVMAGAEDSLHAHRARQALGTLLQDHHDVRSLLSSANLNAETLRRVISENHPQKAALEYLGQDLRTISTMVSTLRERALQEMSSVGGNSKVALAKVARDVIPLVHRRFSRVSVDVSIPESLSVRMAGGGTVLERVLLNVLLNACEGDGSRGASRIWVHATIHGAVVRLRVEDDGVGFPSETRDEPLAPTASSKKEGSGLGLFLVKVVVAASDGSLRLSSRREGGARVDITLPLANA